MKRKTCILLSAALMLTAALLLVSCGNKCTSHVDADKNLTCDVCGAKIPCTHEYTNACDARCNICNEERTPKPHVYTTDCDSSCNVCGEERIPSSHVYTDESDTDCNVCGKQKTLWDDGGVPGPIIPYS